jgi:transcriptional regulator with XRE-family HTH domain
MAQKWREVRGEFTREQEAQIRHYVEDAEQAMKLHQLREARSLTQTNLAEKLRVNQGAVSKIEKRADMYVSTLRGYVEAMGGRLEIRAVFPDGEVVIRQFGELEGEQGDSAA